MADYSGESEIRRSSIDDLPAELLGKILQYVVFAPGEFQVQLDRRGGNPYDVILVSRYWRDVAYSTPQLWVILPGHYPLLWDLIVKRSGTLELRLELYGRVPKERQIWPPKNLKGLVKSGRLQGLTVQHCSRQLMGRVLHIVPSSSSSLRYVHIAEDYDHTVWNDHAEFSTFIQSLEQVTHLVLEGGCIPSIPWSGTLPTPQILSGHPNLRCLCLRGEGSKVLRFLESATLQMLERLEILGNYLTVTEEPRRVFRDFWEGRKGTPQSLAVVYQDIHKFPGAESVHTLEITLCKSRTPGHEPEYSVDAPLLKFTAAVSMESTRNAWETLVVNEVLPLADVEEVAFKDVHMWPGRCADRLLQSLPQVKQITATGLCKIIVSALRPKEVSPSDETPGGVDGSNVTEGSPNQQPQVPAPLLESLMLDSPTRKGNRNDGIQGLLVECVRERRSSGHRLGRLTLRDFFWLQQSEVADLSSVVDVLDFEGEASRDTQEDDDDAIE